MAPKPTMKTFSLHWGSGVVEEEAQITTPYHRPRMPLIIDEHDLAPLRKALTRTPRLRKLLTQLLGPAADVKVRAATVAPRQRRKP